MEKGNFNIDAVMASVKLSDMLKPTAYNIIKNTFPDTVTRLGYEDTYIKGAGILCSIISDMRQGEYGLTEEERTEMIRLFKEMTSLSHPEYAVLMIAMSHVIDRDSMESFAPSLDIAVTAAKILDKFQFSHQILAAAQFYELARCSTNDPAKAKLALFSTIEIHPDDNPEMLHLRNWDDADYPENTSTDEEITYNEVMRLAFQQFWSVLDPFSGPWLQFVHDNRADQKTVDDLWDNVNHTFRNHDAE